ncbi:MAG: hypothetical protein ABIP54_01090 [Candidatus Andersenbacteria bacterium]
MDTSHVIVAIVALVVGILLGRFLYTRKLKEADERLKEHGLPPREGGIAHLGW